MTEKEMLKLMEQAGAYEEGHFLMKSGRHASAFLQCAHLIEHADIADKLCGELAERCRECGADLVIGPALGGMIFGYTVSRMLGKRFIYCERRDGVMTLRRGFRIPRGAKVLVVEDMVTTGGSVREVLEIIRAFEAEPVMVASITDRTRGRVDFGVPFVSLVKIDMQYYPADDCPLCRAGVPMNPARSEMERKA